MPYQIVWTELAKNQLDQIFDYHEEVINSRIASRIIKEIIVSADVLLNAPFIGQVENALESRAILYRYLVHKNYKLIYSIAENDIHIVDVFDTRQNPLKIIRQK